MKFSDLTEDQWDTLIVCCLHNQELVERGQMRGEQLTISSMSCWDILDKQIQPILNQIDEILADEALRD